LEQPWAEWKARISPSQAHGAARRDSSATPTPAASGSSAPGRRERPAGDRGVDGSQQLFALPSGRHLACRVTDGKPVPRPALARLVSCSCAATSSSLRMWYSGSSLRPGGLLHMRGCDASMAAAATHPPAFSYVLYIRHATLGAMAEEAAERAKLLLRGLSPHRQAWTLTAHPNAYGSGPTILNRQLTSVSAGQSGCGAPRRNRTGDPILTMDVLCRLS
jgi:hypothetical protein